MIATKSVRNKKYKIKWELNHCVTLYLPATVKQPFCHPIVGCTYGAFPYSTTYCGHFIVVNLIRVLD